MILQEGMVTADQLPEDVVIRIEEIGSQKAKIQYARFDEEQGKASQRFSTVQGDTCWGTITIEKYSGPNKIPVWEVREVEAGQGYGPLLYDLAMEYATEHGLGLISDRNSVSEGEDGAVNVWDYYMNHRVGDDVEAHQLDDLQNTLTDTYDDNVDQWISKAFAKEEWEYHSTSKRYTKAPTTFEALGNKVIYS